MRVIALFVLGLVSVAVLQTGAAELSTKDLAAAKKVYNTKCLRCHKSYDPASYELREWEEWMNKMRTKARLKTDQYDLLIRYTEDLRNHPPEKKDEHSKHK